MEVRKQFTFYASFFEAMEALSLADRGRAVTMLCQFALKGIEPPPLTGKLKIFMDLTMPNLIASRKKALSGKAGALVTNTIRNGKGEIEIKNEDEVEDDSPPRDRFEKFWDLYPVKVGKEQAWAVWKRLQPDSQQVCFALERWRKSRQWSQQQGRFVPRAAKFLEERHFEQIPQDAMPTGAEGYLDEAAVEAIAQVMKG